MARLRTPAVTSTGLNSTSDADPASTKRRPKRQIKVANAGKSLSEHATQTATIGSRVLISTTRQVSLTPLRALNSAKLLDIEDDASERSNRRPMTSSTVLRNRLRSPQKSNLNLRKLSVSSNESIVGDHTATKIDILHDDAASDDDEDGSPFARRSKITKKQVELADVFQSLRLSPPRLENTDLSNASRKPSTRCSIPLANSFSDKENASPLVSEKRTPVRPVTPPPPSPSKIKLQSPSKTKSKIPSGGLRQSLDAFWTMDTINDWNDQYSPQKALKSPRKLKLDLNPDSTSPTTSPQKLSSPSKRTKAEVQTRKDFEARKQRIASDFLVELDQSITDGEIGRLTAESGGVELIWSRTLNSTAGRANWRRQTIKTQPSDGSASTTRHIHHASIELAEKVIDDEDRLLNVLAHEFCHLANFIVSGIKDQPHGAQFQAWGRKCSERFGDRGVQVTTKHTYAIDYRYIWQCTDEECGEEFKRHSKSIDPTKQRCGRCRASLVQIKPAPRRKKNVNGDQGVDGVEQQVTGYAAYVKEHFADVKKSIAPGSPHKQVMEALGKQYRAEKAANALAAPMPKLRLPMLVASQPLITVDELSKAIETVVLDDSSDSD